MWNGHMTTDYAILQSIRPRSTWSWNTKMKTWIYLKSNRRRPLDRPIKKKIISKLTRLDVLIIFSEKCLTMGIIDLLFLMFILLFPVACFGITVTMSHLGTTLVDFPGSFCVPPGTSVYKLFVSINYLTIGILRFVITHECLRWRGKLYRTPLTYATVIEGSLSAKTFWNNDIKIQRSLKPLNKWIDIQFRDQFPFQSIKAFKVSNFIDRPGFQWPRSNNKSDRWSMVLISIWCNLVQNDTLTQVRVRKEVVYHKGYS